MAKKASNLSPAEQKQQRAKARIESFKKLGTKRTLRLIAYIDLLEKLANKRSYTYDDSQVTKIFSAIETKLASCRKSFNTGAADSSTALEL